MFQKFAKTLCLVAALGAAGVAAPTAASAGDLRATISIGSGGVELVGHRGHGRHWNRGTCSPRHALRKARHFGIHRAHIRGVNRHSITVAGRKHRSHALVRFARVRGCPVIAYR